MFDIQRLLPSSPRLFIYLHTRENRRSAGRSGMHTMHFDDGVGEFGIMQIGFSVGTNYIHFEINGCICLHVVLLTRHQTFKIFDV